TRTNRRAHRLLAGGRAVIAHVALHHQLLVFVNFRHAEWAGQHAVAARDAPRLARALNNAVAGPLDRIRRTDFRARRLLAMHANDRDGLHALRSFDIFEMNHRHTAMRVALRACLHARLATDAAVGIDEKLEMTRLHCCASSLPTYSGGPSARRTRHPQT